MEKSFTVNEGTITNLNIQLVPIGIVSKEESGDDSFTENVPQLTPIPLPSMTNNGDSKTSEAGLAMASANNPTNLTKAGLLTHLMIFLVISQVCLTCQN